MKIQSELSQSRVAHFFSRMDPGGAELRTIEVTRSFRMTFDFYALSGQEGTLDSELREAGNRVWHFRMSVLGLFRLARSIKANRYRVAHCHLGAASGVVMLLATLLRVPIRIAHFRSDAVGGRSSLRRSLLLWLSRLLVNACATKIVGVSPGALDFGWREDWRKDSRCLVVPNGIDPGPLRSRAASGVAMRQTIDAEVLLVNVGRSEPSKNRKRAIEVYEEIGKTHSTILYLVGELDDADRALVAASNSMMLGKGSIVSVGQSTNVPLYLGLADTLLVTSWREGLPGVILEALAVGLPVVSSDLPGAIWINSKVEGSVLCSLDDSNSVWAAAVGKAITSDGIRIRESFDRGPFLLDHVLPVFAALWELENTDTYA